MMALDKFKGWLVTAALFVLAVAAAFFKVWRAGAAWEATRSQQAKEKAVREARSVENEIAGVADRDLDRHLGKWVRDKGER